MNEIYIKKLLEEFRVNKRVIEQLRSTFDIDSILNVAFKEKMYDIILELFKPIELDNEIKMYFDIFSYLSPITEGLPNFIDKFEVSESEKGMITRLIYSIDMNKIKKAKIKDTLPRKISGWGHPVNSINDVIYYAEPACLETMIFLFNNNIRTTMNDTDGVYDEPVENGICCVWIDYDSLSEENKSVANQLISMNIACFIENEPEKTIAIKVPCNRNETVGTVSEKLKSIAQAFVKQPILYGSYPKEQMLTKIREYIKNGIYNDNYLPDRSDTYFGYCIKLIESGDVKENPNGNLQTEDGKTFLIDDFINVISNSREFIQLYIDYYYPSFYYDEVEERFWQSKDLYMRHVESLKQMNSEWQQLSQNDIPKKI